jgi:N-acetylmuramoyl-L-alanine amidase
MGRKIILSAGHGGKDPGASGNNYIERDLAIELRDMVVAELQKEGIEPLTDSNTNALSQTLAWLRGKFSKRDILVDIHWNASANVEAKGSEVIVPDNVSKFEHELAQSLLKIFTSVGFKDRGIRPEKLTARRSLAWMKADAETVLIEVCFITNLTDMKLYQANKWGIARRIAGVLKSKSNE